MFGGPNAGLAALERAVVATCVAFAARSWQAAARIANLVRRARAFEHPVRGIRAAALQLLRDAARFVGAARRRQAATLALAAERRARARFTRAPPQIVAAFFELRRLAAHAAHRAR